MLIYGANMPFSVQNGKTIVFKKKANLLMLKQLLFGLTLS